MLARLLSSHGSARFDIRLLLVRHLVSAVFDRALITPSSTPVTVSSSSSKAPSELPVTVSDAYLLIQVKSHLTFRQ